VSAASGDHRAVSLGTVYLTGKITQLLPTGVEPKIEEVLDSAAMAQGLLPGFIPLGTRLRLGLSRITRSSPAVILSILALVVSSLTFYRNFLYVNDELKLIPTGITNYLDGRFVLRVAVVNSGTRDVAVATVKVAYWRDEVTDETLRDKIRDLPASADFVRAHWDTSLGALSIEPFALKSREIKLLEIRGTLNTFDLFVEAGHSRPSADENNRAVAVGLTVEAIDSSGLLIPSEFPVSYFRLQRVDKPDEPGPLRAWARSPVLVRDTRLLFDVGVVKPPDTFPMRDERTLVGEESSQP
jgi:hypothetical protein